MYVPMRISYRLEMVKATLLNWKLTFNASPTPETEK